MLVMSQSVCIVLSFFVFPCLSSSYRLSSPNAMREALRPLFQPLSSFLFESLWRYLFLKSMTKCLFSKCLTMPLQKLRAVQIVLLYWWFAFILLACLRRGDMSGMSVSVCVTLQPFADIRACLELFPCYARASRLEVAVFAFRFKNVAIPIGP